MPSSLWPALAAGLLSWHGVAASGAATPFSTSFELSARAEVIAAIVARCGGCAWDRPGREAVTLSISLDGRYVAHLPLVRPGRHTYRVMLGAADAGRHTIRAAVDRAETSVGLRAETAAAIEGIAVERVPESAAGHAAIAHAPFVYARPNTIGRFSDVPVFMWYEVEPTPRGRRLRYSVVFTNEDGGTPADRLMATWGRTTDIEYVYSVELGADGAVIADDFQGPDHETMPFTGRREGRHPLLWVVTDNNMLLDSGTTRIRYAPAPVAFPLDAVSREAVMDANPWLYELAAQELAREGKIVEGAPPGRGAVPDPRRFAYIEACGDVGSAALAFEIQAGDGWLPSDRGVSAYRIVRSGCFRAAVPLPSRLGADDLRTLRVLAHPRQGKPGEPAPAPSPVRLERINTVFMLTDGHTPGPSLLRWTGPATILVGSPLEIPFANR